MTVLSDSEHDLLRYRDATAIGYTVRVVARRFQPRVADTDEIVHRIDSFIGISTFWTMPKICTKVVVDANWSTIQLSLARVAAYELFGCSESEEIAQIVKHKRFADSLVMAVNHGNHDMMKWLVEIYLPTGRIREAVGAAVRNGRWQFLKWLKEKYDDRVMWTASEFKRDTWTGQSGMLRWLYQLSEEKNLEDKAYLLDAAAMSGELVLVHWGLSACKVFTYSKFINLVKTTGLKAAAAHGQLDTLDWAIAKFGCSIVSDLIGFACERGQVNTVEWLMRNYNQNPDLTALAKAVKTRQWSFVMHALAHNWLGRIDNACLAAYLLDAAVLEGEEKVVESLLTEYPFSTEWLSRCAEQAANRGMLELVKLLLAHPSMTPNITPISVTVAVFHGQFDVIRWLDEQGRALVSLDPIIWSTAARRVSIDQLFLKRASAIAPSGPANYFDTVSWLLRYHDQHRMHAIEELFQKFLAIMMEFVSRDGRLEVVALLHSKCHDSTACLKAFESAAGKGYLPIMQWLHTHCEHISTARLSLAIRSASKNGHVHAMEWLDSIPRLNDIHPSIDYVAIAELGHLAVLDYCFRRDPELIVPVAAINTACSRGQLEILLKIYSQSRVIKGRISDEALDATPIEALQFLAAHLGPEFISRVELCTRTHLDKRRELKQLGVLVLSTRSFF